MTYREIFRSAAALVAEDITDGTAADYEDRACYILAIFCNQTAGIDKRYRLANGLQATALTELVCVDLDAEFPLHAIFAPIAAYYLGSALSADENDAMSERLFERYTDAIASVVSALPAASTHVSDAYGLI
jgi:hypothetical protein